MNETVLVLFAIFGITFYLKESSMFARVRNFLIRLHPIFYAHFSCYYCVGIISGLIMYLLLYGTANFDIIAVLIWMFASGALSFLTSVWVDSKAR